MNLTATQLNAARYHGSTTVSAGPGCGKTAILCERVRWLVEDQMVDPRSVHVNVFTRGAAAEIRSRLGPIGRQVDIDTFHARAARAILPRGWTVADDITDKSFRHALTYRKSTRRMLDARKEQTNRDIIRYESTGKRSEPVKELMARMAKQRMIPYWALVPLFAASDPEIPAHSLVDEVQDCTPLEITISSRASHVFRVGDPRQAIMQWRGAAPMDRLSVRFNAVDSFRFGHAFAQTINHEDSTDSHALRGAIHSTEIKSRAPNWDALNGTTLVLARDHDTCKELAEMIPRSVHIKRDPLDPFASEADRFADVWSSGRIVISTYHSAKGREADNVVLWPFVIDCADEQRVRYVGLTRAKRLVFDLRDYTFEDLAETTSYRGDAMKAS